MQKIMKLDYKDIDDYISMFPKEIRSQLEKIRKIISNSAPQATEHISYGMPTFKVKKVLAHFGAQKTHIGFYPGPAPIAHFHNELLPYSTSKGTVRFEIGKPLPSDLISKMVDYKLNLIQK